MHKILYRDKPKQDACISLITEHFNANPNDNVATIHISRGKPLRSEAQSRLYFKWRDLIGEFLGNSKEETHRLLKNTFLDGGSTKELTMVEFVDYLREIETLADELGVKLPRGEDYNLVMFKG